MKNMQSTTSRYRMASLFGTQERRAQNDLQHAGILVPKHIPTTFNQHNLPDVPNQIESHQSKLSEKKNSLLSNGGKAAISIN